MAEPPDLQQHSGLCRSNWRGLISCPYPYVTERIVALSDGVPGWQILKENAAPLHLYNHTLYPEWGVMLWDESTGYVEGEEGEDRDDGDYSLISIEGR